jgi:DNA ligase (NAD+)
VGPTIASSLHAWFADERNRKLVRRLVEAGVSTRAEEDGQPEVPQVLAGRSVVLTGALESRTREQAARAVEERGGRVASSVSKKTDFVVVGADPGSKAERARELGVTMVDEAGFQRLLEKGEAV